MGRRVTEIYMSTGIYCEFTRQEQQVIVKKSKSFKQVNFLGGKSSLGGNSNDLGSMSSSNPPNSTFRMDHKISGKTTAVMTDEPMFGFCDDD